LLEIALKLAGLLQAGRAGLSGGTACCKNRKDQTQLYCSTEAPQTTNFGGVLICLFGAYLLLTVGAAWRPPKIPAASSRIVIFGQIFHSSGTDDKAKLLPSGFLEGVSILEAHAKAKQPVARLQPGEFVQGNIPIQPNLNNGGIWRIRVDSHWCRKLEIYSLGGEVLEGRRKNFNPRFADAAMGRSESFIRHLYVYLRRFSLVDFLDWISRCNSQLRSLARDEGIGTSLSCAGLDYGENGDDKRGQNQGSVYPEPKNRIIKAIGLGYISFFLGWGLLWFDVWFLSFFDCHRWLRSALWGSGLLLMAGGLGSVLLLQWHALQRTRQKHQNESETQSQTFHGGKSVTQKCLTNSYLCNTVIGMANVLSKDKQIAAIGALAEGSSIRSIERLTGIHRDTIMRLGVHVGKGCEMLLDSKMQDLGCRYLQFDEVWGFIGKKERHLHVGDDPEMGDVWTYCAIDAETKLVPTFRVGKRNRATTTAFVQDVASRLRNRVQISTDALHGYVEAIEQSFGADVDYGQIVKVYTHDEAQHPERKYSAPHFASAMRRPIAGDPDMELVSTSHIERLNATTRLHVKRLSRLTLAFSKKLENFKAAVALHFAYYNLVRRHNALRCTPAMAAGIERDFWTVGDLVEAAA